MMMVHPADVLNEQARYQELLRKAEAEQRFAAGPAEAVRPRVGLTSLLAFVGTVLKR